VECLTWAVRGKTSNEIAQIIGLITQRGFLH
jgi:DNA-binding CsgD family transcriptional regulator